MRTVRQYLRLSWLALAAVAAMSSLANDASASSTKASGGCCVKRACAAGCCEVACPAVLPKRADVFDNDSAVKVEVSNRGSVPCECGSSDQSAPAHKPESVRFEQRAENDGAGSTDPSVIEPRETSSTRLSVPSTRLPKAHLYLRTSRLLI